MKIINNIVQKFFDINFYKLVFLISCFFYCIPFTHNISAHLFKLTVIWGVTIFLYNYFYNIKYNFKKADYLLLALLVFSLLSCFWGITQDFPKNAMAVVYLFTQTVLLISYNRTSSLEQKVKEIQCFSNTAVALTFPFGVISILVFCLNAKDSFTIVPNQYVSNFLEGSLYTQEHLDYLVQFGLISIWLSISSLIINKKYYHKKHLKFFLYTNIVVQTIGCILLNLRSTIIGAIVSIGFLVLALIRLNKRKCNQNIKSLNLKNIFITIAKYVFVLICLALVCVIVKQYTLVLLCLFAYLFHITFSFIQFLFTFKSDAENNKFIYKIVTVNMCIICSLLAINILNSHLLYFCPIFSVAVFWNSISIINNLLDSVSNEKRTILFTISNFEDYNIRNVLIDLINNIDTEENSIEIKALFNESKYINDLHKNVKYSYVIKKPTLLKKRILSNVIKYFPKKFVYTWFITKNYDVEIAFSESLPVKLLCGSTSPSIKLTWLHHDIFGSNYMTKQFSNKKKIIRNYQNFDRIVCISDSIRESFEKNTNLYQNTITICNPIDRRKTTEKSQLNCDIKSNPDKFTIVTIGSPTEQNSYLRLCKIINSIVEYKQNIELWILGNTPNLENYIEENDLKGHIKLLDFKDNPYRYLKQADLLISGFFAEEYSLIVSEANALDIPVLTPHTLAIDDLLEHDKCENLIENSLTSYIINLIDNPEKLNKLRQQYCFKSENHVKQIKELFRLKDRIDKKCDLFCTVFTPTYNRGYIIEKLYNSLKNQTYKNFEWVVVDDGSSDNTEKLFEKWCKEELSFKINYIKVSNGGKQRAINKGLDVAKGKMFFIVDSDDSLSENAIERLNYYEKTIKDYDDFAGISGLKGYDKENAIGSRNEAEYIDTISQQREKFNLLGDKAECYYTDLLKRYRFPEVSGEKFVTECIVWDRISFAGYKIRWFNEIIYFADYLEDGYTNEGTSLFEKNPIGFLLYVRNEKLYFPLDIKKQIGNYYRYYKMMQDKKPLTEIADDLLTNKWFIKFSETLCNIKLKIKGR